jgi:UDP-2-acetamido-2,6-beta-L-arabino-hexul-4-ose reductase
MKKILITGANGFVGKNLSIFMEEQGFEVLKITRSTPKIDMYEMALHADYCFHLAGEVRPDASAEDFLNSNLNFTKELLSALSQKPIDIVFTSTVHANNSVNDYGKTKSDAENLIYDYAQLNDVDAHIYRLPHLFGPHCKPNYNSVITTWIYNALNDIELKVFDENYELTYIYVGDVVNTFFEQINKSETLPLPVNYKIKLGELKCLILKLASNSYVDISSKFLKKLNDTVSFYKGQK